MYIIESPRARNGSFHGTTTRVCVCLSGALEENKNAMERQQVEFPRGRNGCLQHYPRVQESQQTTAVCSTYVAWADVYMRVRVRCLEHSRIVAALSVVQ